MRICTALTACLLAAFLANAEEETLAWPLDLPRILTSSFAEYRGGRFHAGIDLRTLGNGRVVRAADAGHVSRIRCSPYGYGKAVYLAMDNGYTAVYAHLDGFAPELEAYVQRHQHRREQYTVDLYPRPGEFPFERGEVLCYSGETGVGVPHLHYELRDASARPMNPRLLGVDWPDGQAPELGRLLLVERGRRVRILEASDVAGALQVAGPVGLGIEVVDHSHGNRLGVHVLRVRLNDEEHFRVQNDQLNYSTIDGGAVAWHPYLQDEGRFQVLWRWPGNNSPNYAHSDSDGWIDLAEGETAELVVEAVDFAGNAAARSLTLRHASAARPPASDGAEDAARTTAEVELQPMGDWLFLTVESYRGTASATPRLVLGGQAAPFSRSDDGSFFSAWSAPETPPAGRFSFAVHGAGPLPEEIGGIYVRRSAPEQLFELDEDLQVRVGGNSAYDALVITAEREEPRSASGLSPQGPRWRLSPGSAPIDRPLTVRLRAPNASDAREMPAVYRGSGDSWRRLDTRRSGDWLEAETGALGVFAVFTDAEDPRLDIQAPASGLRTSDKRPTIEAVVQDKGSGISDWTVRANGEWLLTAYDPEHDRIYWAQDEDLPLGEVVLSFACTDSAGNRSEVERTVFVQE